MRTKIFSAILAGGLTVAAGAALAGEPRLLTDGQMDGVNAGSAAFASGASVTFGDALSETVSISNAIAVNGFAQASNTTAGIAASVLFGASSVSGSVSAASLP